MDWSDSRYGRKSGGIVWTRELALGFREMKYISSPDEDLLDFWTVMLRPELALIIKSVKFLLFSVLT
jgi:hypothetical protein